MSTATDYLESGRRALVGIHGESLTWIPASAVIALEWGEVLTNEQAKAIFSNLTDEDGNTVTVAFTAVFDEAYQVLGPSGEIASTSPAVTNVKASDLPAAGRGDIIQRGSVYYFVNAVEPDGRGAMVLILSKHAH